MVGVPILTAAAASPRRRRAVPVRLAGAAALVAGLTLAGGAAASASPTATAVAGSSCAALPASFGYSEYAKGTVNETHGDSDGPTAFGGPTTLGNFSMSYGAAAGASGFVAGGPVSGGGTTSVRTGDGYADANVTGVSFQTGTLHQVAASALPVNFTTTASDDAALAAQVAALPTTAGDLIATGGTTLTLTATATASDGQYVWDLAPGQLAAVTAVKVVGVPAGGTVVVNVPDTGSLSPTVTSVTLDGTTSSGSGGPAALADSTLFNFSGASTLTLTGTWAGTLFAPGASVTFSSGHVYGTVVGANLTGTNESTYGPLDSALCLDLGPATALPEGRPLLLAGAGAAVLAAGSVLALRRRRTA